MDKRLVAVVLSIIAIFAVTTIALQLEQSANHLAGKVNYTYSVVNTYPHDTVAFTQGLVFVQGSLFESTGGYGSSSLRRVDLLSGEVRQEYSLPSDFFGEGLAEVDGLLVQLTWQNRLGFVYDMETLELKQNFSISTEGWGLTYDGNNLVMSDGTDRLYFLNPATFEVVRTISVKDGETLIKNINELEFIGENIYANIFMTEKIAIINPLTGEVTGWIDLTGIYQHNRHNDVLNGIAYDDETDRLFVTGKCWPYLYEITIKSTN